LFGIEELQHKWTSCNDARTTRQKISTTVNQLKVMETDFFVHGGCSVGI